MDLLVDKCITAEWNRHSVLQVGQVTNKMRSKIAPLELGSHPSSSAFCGFYTASGYVSDFLGRRSSLVEGIGDLAAFGYFRAVVGKQFNTCVVDGARVNRGLLTAVPGRF